MVLSNRYAFSLLIDERILGIWTLDGHSSNIILGADGTAQTMLTSARMKNGTFRWETGNILIITYDDLTYDVLRFDIVKPNVAIITMGIYGTQETVITIGQRQSNSL